MEHGLGVGGRRKEKGNLTSEKAAAVIEFYKFKDLKLRLLLIEKRVMRSLCE